MTKPEDEILEISGELTSPFETEKAFHFFSGDKTVWLPKSLVEWYGEEKTMLIPGWLAKEKGLI